MSHNLLSPQNLKKLEENYEIVPATELLNTIRYFLGPYEMARANENSKLLAHRVVDERGTALGPWKRGVPFDMGPDENNCWVIVTVQSDDWEVMRKKEHGTTKYMHRKRNNHGPWHRGSPPSGHYYEGVTLDREAESLYLPGSAKLLEEMHELGQVMGKLMAYPSGDHPDGKGHLMDRFCNELGDVMAACDFVRQNIPITSRGIIDRQREIKLELFRKWHLGPDGPMASVTGKPQ